MLIRKYFMVGACSLTLLLNLEISASAEEPLPIYKNPILDWESLPTIRTGVRVWSHTSKNPINFTIMDWTNYTLRDEDGYELAHYKGNSGMLVQAWFGSFEGLGNQKLYLHDEKTPDYDKPFPDYFNGTASPFNLWHQNQKILWAFPCLRFESVFKAVVAKRPQWYQYTLDLYREPRFSEAIHREELATVQQKIEQPVGTFPGANLGNQTESSHPTISPNRTVTVFDFSAPGVLRSIEMQLPTDNETIDNIIIRVTTDSQVTAELPLCMFFGSYPGTKIQKAQGMPAGFDGTKLYFYFPMPFWKSMKVELINHSAKPISLISNIGWSDSNSYPEDSTGIFKIQFNNKIDVNAGAPAFTSLSVAGSGTMVGCVSRIVGGIESNFTSYTDDSETPVIETTGGEDYFNHSYGMHDGLSTAFSGGLAGKEIGYRFQIIDSIPFLSSFKFTQDHALNFAHDRNGTFLSAVFYYHNPKKLLILTDSVDIGKVDSELAHHYRIEGDPSKVRTETDQGTYENDDATLLSEDGRWTDKKSSFTAVIDPNNDGVRIRKRINQTAYHQDVDVYVDGILVGTWFEQGSNYVNNYDQKAYLALLTQKYADQGKTVPNWKKGDVPAIFRDIIFDVPASLTQGKKTLQLRFVTKSSLSVHSEDTGLTNEYYYWIYSYYPVTAHPSAR